MTPLRLLSVLLATALLAPAPRALAADPVAKAAEPPTISHGSKVELSDYLVHGKTTVFDFSSVNCPVCKAMAPGLRKLHTTRADIAVVFVDINRPDAQGIDWDSPVSVQYGVQSPPQFKVFGPDGKLKAEGKPAFEMVADWIN
jgi:thiol-disulfide isomerase/thioredoxin